jgi:hypothetical protein
MPAPDTRHPELLAEVRRRVRDLLQQSDGWGASDPQDRRRVAKRMVDVGMIAAGLLAEDKRITDEVERSARARRGLAQAQAAGDQLGMQATRSAADTLEAVKDAIDFPTYVGSLITGVFQAILTSSVTQVGALGEMLDNVAATADEFAEGSVSDTEVTRWAVQKFRWMTADDSGTLQIRPGVEISDHAGELQTALSASSSEVGGIDPSDLDSTLTPLIRRKLGRDKQTALASMVQMGLQRIVVDEGRIHASMDLRVDAQSASQEQRNQRDDWRVNAAASAQFGTGMWGASASASTSIGQVKSDAQYTAEQIGVRAGLRSSVDLAFRTEQVPLTMMADPNARARIDNNARVPADVSGGQSILQDIHQGFQAPSLDVPATPAAPAAPAVHAPQSPTQQSQQAPRPQQGQQGQQPRPTQTPQQGQQGQQPRPTPTQTPAQTPTQTPSQTPASTQTPSQTPASTQTPSQTPASTQTPSQISIPGLPFSLAAQGASP